MPIFPNPIPVLMINTLTLTTINTVNPFNPILITKPIIIITNSQFNPIPTTNNLNLMLLWYILLYQAPSSPSSTCSLPNEYKFNFSLPDMSETINYSNASNNKLGTICFLLPDICILLASLLDPVLHRHLQRRLISMHILQQHKINSYSRMLLIFQKYFSMIFYISFIKFIITFYNR